MDLFALKAVLGLDTSGYDKGINDAKGKAEGFGSVLKKGFGTAAKVGGAAIAAASTAVVAFGKSAVDAGQTFDSSMSQVAATMGYTVEQLNTEGSEAANTFNTLRDFAQKMGSETAFSASESAEALNYMALAGYDAETSMKMLPNVLNLASAGAMSLSSASDMVTDAQSALGLTLDETTALVDKMATTASKSNTSVSQLGEAILTIGGTASVLKGGTTELSAALGILADNGIKGAEGGTHLRNVLLSLSAPTDTAASTLESLGVSTTDTSGNLRSLEDIMGDLNKSLEGMGEADKAKIISQIFNKTDIAAVNALLSTSGSRWKELSSAIDDSKGSAEAMAKTQLDNLAGDVTLFQSALEGAKIAISDGLTPALRTFVQFGSSSVSTLTKAFKEGGLSGLSDAFGSVVSQGLDKVLGMLPNVIEAGTSLLTALIRGIISATPKLVASIPKLIKSVVKGIANGLPQIAKAGKDLVSSLSKSVSKALQTGFDLPSMLMNLLTGGQVKSATASSLYQFVDQSIKPALKTALEKLFGDGSAADAIVSGFNTAISAIGDIVDTFKSAFSTVVDFVTTNKDTLISVLSAVVGGFVALKTALTITDTIKTLKTAFDTVKTAISGLFALISAHPMMILVVAIGAVIGYLVNLYRTNETFRDKVKAAWDTVKTAISGAWENTIKPAWESLKSFINDTLVPAFTTFWNDTIKPFGEYLEGAFSDAWEGIKTFFSGTLPDAINVIMAGFTLLKIKVLEPLGAFLANTFSAAWNAISDFFTNTLPPAITAIQTEFETFKNTYLVPLGDFLTQTFLAAWEGIQTFFSDTLPTAIATVKIAFFVFKSAVLEPLGEYIGGKFADAWAAIKDYWENDLSPRLQELKDAFDTFKTNVLEPLGTFLTDTFSAAWEGIVSLFGGEGQEGGVGGAIASLGATLNNLYENYIKPVAEYVAGTFSTVWETWKGVINGIITFLTGAFKGDWESAWNGLVDAFGSIFNGIKELVKTPLNAVIGFLNGLIGKVELTINRLIRGINGALSINIPAFGKWIDVPDWLGGPKYVGFPGYSWRPGLSGVTFGRIPALANGGILGNGGHAIVGEAGPEYLRVVNGQAVVTPMKGMAGGGDTYNNTINVYQQPGENAEELAERVQRVLARQQRQRRSVYA